jgi:hypothetical protein
MTLVALFGLLGRRETCQGCDAIIGAAVLRARGVVILKSPTATLISSVSEKQKK